MIKNLHFLRLLLFIDGKQTHAKDPSALGKRIQMNSIDFSSHSSYPPVWFNTNVLFLLFFGPLSGDIVCGWKIWANSMCSYENVIGVYLRCQVYLSGFILICLSASKNDLSYESVPQNRITNTTYFSHHWNTKLGTLETVRGRGVVGHEPILNPADRPNHAYQYSSHVSLQAPSGHMWGTFLMERADGISFDCRIPPFALDSTLN